MASILITGVKQYDRLEEQYAAIVLDEKSMDEYRTLRRKTRGRVVGGGFGVGGALKRHGRCRRNERCRRSCTYDGKWNR